MGAARVRVIEDDADIATVGITAREPHPRAERVGQRNVERKKQRPRAVVAANRVTILELKPQQHLRHVVAARA